MWRQIHLKEFKWLRQTTAASLRSDLMAGLTGAAVVLPQAVAFAAIAGLPPEYGLYTAMVPTIVAAIFGSSLVMVSGPASAISAVVFSALSGRYQPGSVEFIQAAILLAFLVGVIQVALAMARVGRLAGFVSHSVMIGFTAAAALLIFVSQLGPALGMPSFAAHGILDRLLGLSRNLAQINPMAAVCAGVTLVVAIGFRIFLPRWPGFLIAIFAGTVVILPMGEQAASLTRIGALPSAFPAFHLPNFTGFDLPQMFESAFAISLICLLEAIAIGRSMAHRAQHDFSANREVFGQGLSNIAGSFFQSYPSSGSFTRSGVNIEAGATSPIAAIAATFFLIAMVLVFAPFIGLVPIASVSGLILYVAYRLLDFNEMLHLLRTSRTESAIVAVTFFIGMLVNLEFAIYIGTFTSLAVFLGRSANPALVVGAPDPDATQRKIKNAEIFDLPECPSVLIVRLDGPLFFGSVESLNAKFRKLMQSRPEQINMILILYGVGEVDLPGVELLETEVKRRRAAGGNLFVVAQYPPLQQKLRRLGLDAVLGEGRIFGDKRTAIAAAVENVVPNTCAQCSKRVFRECSDRPDSRPDTAKSPAAQGTVL